MDFKWIEVNLERIEESSVPATSGVYVIKQVERIYGIANFA